ncbi:MAG: hypothetical protein H6780_01205 [Candidatus Nomurabacteria bacterium]|nr:MAG: hypothetical protein H6780_01205 [Candidatus Nomurabacteria bacterium]
MSKSLLTFVLILVIIGAAWWVWHEMSDSAVEVEIGTNQTATTSPEEFVEIETTDVNIYRNEDWGFQFEYPQEWEVREPAFVSGVSLFNMAIGPAPANGITINITPKNWIEGAMTKMKARGVVFEEIFLDGKSAYKTYDKDGWSRPAILTLVLVSDEYWIDITGISKYEEEYNQIIESFEFIE